MRVMQRHPIATHTTSNRREAEATIPRTAAESDTTLGSLPLTPNQPLNLLLSSYNQNPDLTDAAFDDCPFDCRFIYGGGSDLNSSRMADWLPVPGPQQQAYRLLTPKPPLALANNRQW